MTIPAELLAEVPGCSPREPSPRVLRLQGGRSNRAFLVTGSAGDFVLRLGAEARTAAALGVDRGAELATQRVAAAAGIAPRVLVADATRGFIVMEYVPGAALPPDWQEDPRRVAALATVLDRVRRLTPPPGLPRLALPDRIDELHTRLQASRPSAAAALAPRIAAARRDWVASGAGQREPCVVHSDPNPDNIIERPDGSLLLLDWEYAHLGDPLQDAAAVLALHPTLGERARDLLGAAAGPTAVDMAMLEAMARVYRVLDESWSQLAAAA